MCFCIRNPIVITLAHWGRKLTHKHKDDQTWAVFREGRDEQKAHWEKGKGGIRSDLVVLITPRLIKQIKWQML